MQRIIVGSNLPRIISTNIASSVLPARVQAMVNSEFELIFNSIPVRIARRNPRSPCTICPADLSHITIQSTRCSLTLVLQASSLSSIMQRKLYRKNRRCESTRERRANRRTKLLLKLPFLSCLPRLHAYHDVCTEVPGLLPDDLIC
ncbi:uncharacterized protein FOMMEDRAFT_168050 [Fomitiporia mediterranea MF3/22]|uniref:uncharacterized protein n=1 Tax=Fomitiporia mediterranea (strain MF3/22) TaxID=694068 RepID=UPI0004407BE4|nr:uncharacterized protein FOMMEDRAFT_168050 [Fomitiporia mediterranea MF3/22]EJD02947.1 hypothetical protein FOMMEDRAFT_168050 [Fomitiporia mediterranea MF3/22]